MTPSQLSAVLGRLPSGLFILTIGHGGRETGMLASWVMQAGFDPPMVTAAIRQDRFVAKWLTAGAPFVLNMLSDKQKSLMSHFGRGFELGEPAFEGLALRYTAGGVPILPGITGYLECEPSGHIDSGDHRIFLAQVVGGKLAEGEPPMVHIRKSGLKY